MAPALAVLVSVLAAPALADDPKDPAMRSRAAREADAAEIRRLNREEAAYVQQRDARYAQGWQDWRDARDARGGYQSRSGSNYAQDMRDHDAGRSAADDDRRSYARARADYEAAMAEWRHDVSACRAGYYEHCAR
ncbi:hypothetical protein [Novosphingobium profundi]|uniref:hypothetical protein n=1 Tax=Novosphingobium profundi TaxID=1774954 RepID=UPI001FE90BA1|nr:hypothetical protein [Novosphingobium profundi]